MALEFASSHALHHPFDNYFSCTFSLRVRAHVCWESQLSLQRYLLNWTGHDYVGRLPHFSRRYVQVTQGGVDAPSLLCLGDWGTNHGSSFIGRSSITGFFWGLVGGFVLIIRNPHVCVEKLYRLRCKWWWVDNINIENTLVKTVFSLMALELASSHALHHPFA